MDDKGIIKALKCFSENKDFTLDYCRGCLFDGEPLCCENASEGITKAALGLIEKQQKEIERLKAENEKAIGYLATCFDKYEKTKIAKESLEDTIYIARTEIIKEFVNAIEKRLEHNWDASWEVFHSVMGSIHELAASRGVE